MVPVWGSRDQTRWFLPQQMNISQSKWFQRQARQFLPVPSPLEIQHSPQVYGSVVLRMVTISQTEP
jgi:hypothetical protein